MTTTVIIFKRLISWLMSVIVMLSSAPIQPSPETGKEAGQTAGSEILEEIADLSQGNPLWSALIEMNKVMIRYLGPEFLSEEEIVSAVYAMDEETMLRVKEDIDSLQPVWNGLGEEEKEMLFATDTAKSLGILYDTVDSVLNPVLQAAGTNSVLGGKVLVTDSLGTGVVSGDSVTITAKGSTLSAKTNTVDIYNNSSTAATLRFEYSASGFSSFSESGTKGKYVVVLEPDKNITITIKANAGKTATLVLNNFSLVPATDNSDIVFSFDSSSGKVTVDGADVTAGSSKSVSFKSGAKLVATPAVGTEFVAWVDALDNRVLSTNKEYVLKPASAMTVKAVFGGKISTPYFLVDGGKYLFDDLNEAAAYAANAGSKTVVLMNNATLPAGNYTVPAGVTLLVPFDDAHTVYTTVPECVSGTHTAPTAYRTLTMSTGAHITVNGVLSLPAKHYSAVGGRTDTGSPDGACSFIKMHEGSSITVNRGAALYAYGFITGSGSVTAKNGSSVYEYFQVMDFRGGSQTSDMKNGVFPLSQYYIQNIEVPLTIESGAVESCYTTMCISNMNLGAGVEVFAKSGAMFNLSSGTVTKYYDVNTDRLVFELNGEMSISPIELSIGSGILSTKINSKNYELPINGNITVNVASGKVILSQDVSLLPGAEIIIGENGSCILASGTNVYLYDSAEWGNFCGAYNKPFIPLTYAPGRKYNRKASDLKDAKIRVDGLLDASQGYLYTTVGGADICGGEKGEARLKKGTQTATYQLVQGTGYSNIGLTPAKLKNADGTYKEQTASSSTSVYNGGIWKDHAAHQYSSSVTLQPDCENDGVRTFTCFCGSTYTEKISATGHKHGDDATCTDAQICLTCGKELKAPLGHKYVSVVTAPTCTEKGYTTHTCSKCGEVTVNSEVAALGHKPDKAPSCTEKSFCTVCGEMLSDAKGHSYSHTVTAPTCTEKGFTTHKCTVCGDSYTDSVVPENGHTPGAEATCTEPQSCTVCGDIIKAENGHAPGASATCTEAQICTVCGIELKAALGHETVHLDSVEPTCLDDGYSSGSHCTRCGYSEGSHVLPAKGHSPGAAATCTHNQICTECFAEIAPAKGHNYRTQTILPTCSTMGYTVHTCLNCGDSYTDSQTAPKGHTPDKAASCTQAQLCTDCGDVLADATGHTAGESATCDKAQTCLKCGEIVSPAKGHTPGRRATCTNAQFCTECGTEIAPMLEHKLSKTETPATCTENGITVYTCSRCRYQYIESESVAMGHSMVAATCTTASHCSVCGYTEGQALGHTPVIDEGIPAFCEDEGLTDGSHCSVCDEVLAEQEVIPALGHNIVEVPAKAPTYTSVGWEAHEKCTRCAYSTRVEIPRLESEGIVDFETFMINLALLEEMAISYATEVPGKDPAELVIKYIRTGVEDYVDGSWGIMAGYEDKGFADYVARVEDEYNSMEGIEEFIIVSEMKNIELFELPNGDLVDFGHMFGAMDITYHNKKSRNHADVAGWAGDIVDLIEFSDYGGTDGSLDEMIKTVSEDYLLKDNPDEVGGFNQQDIYADMDALYLMNNIIGKTYSDFFITSLFEEYFTEELTLESRADYFLKNRLGGVSTRQDIRNAVYNAYTGNKMITTLEATREFKTNNLADLRKACCYAFADYICSLAGDYVENTANPYFTVFASETSNLAPGIVQNIKHATSADNKQMVFYTATADLTRDDVHIFANYKDNDPTKWGMQPVLTQANAAQEKYGNPESEHYVENYNVIASINGDGYNMSTGEPGGLLVMDGKEYHGPSANGFFGITKDGKAIIGTTEEYNTIYKGQLKEAVGGFGSRLIKNGEIEISKDSSYYTTRHSRTAIGITRTGKVVFMVLDGRQEPVSCGGSMVEIAHILYEAGCVEAINLDGGGSTTFVSKPEGTDELKVVNKPSDGTSRSVSTSLIMVSTAPNSTAFDHAVIESETDYLTKGASVQLTASGVSATGNSAPLPEGTSWMVSDEKWGTVTADGVFTALRNGSVDVNLMLGEDVLGTITLNVVVPDRIYFSKTNIDTVYGAKTELPIIALYENKPVTIAENDVVFTLSNNDAGVIDGSYFIGTDGTGIKNLTVYAALAADDSVTASVVISLYNQGELSFDFDQATGGDRTFAWYREVSNSVTEDNNLYEAIDPEKPMETSYSFAIDMTQIPIPEQLEELTSLLPGAELENASAWTFLMQLAERVSVLTQVKPTVVIDSRFDVDYSEMKVINDYFALTSTEFDEDTNTLTLTLNWIDQTQAIDPAMANPLCILSGIKLTPKADAEWKNDRIAAVHSGEVSYKVYMRATALYSFANKTENQQNYGIYPFVNPSDENEKGGWFGAVYSSFTDTYTLSKAIKEGWVNEGGGFAYYADGEKYTGIKLVDGYYYDFGENGINVGQTKFTGVFCDEKDSLYRYAKLGELVTGWQLIGEDWYYFHSDTKAAREGKYKVGAVEYEFEENGRLVSGVWAKCVFGTRYYYGPSFHQRGWLTIDGNRYYFYGGYRYEGIRCVQESNSEFYTWYDFGTDGICKDEIIPDGFYNDADGSLSYVVNGIALEGLHEIDGAYYLFDYRCKAVKGKEYAAETHCDLPTGVYTFGDDYKALHGIYEIDGEKIYYYKGRPKAAGLVYEDGYYYFASGDGKLVTNKVQYAWETNGLLPATNYEYGADGRMLDGIVNKNGTLYYYELGKAKAAGLVYVDGYYYFAGGEGELVTNKVQYAWETNGLLPEASYEFGPDGKMLDGIVNKNGVLTYFVNGKPKRAGLLLIDGDYYYSSGSNGELTVNAVKYVSETNGLLSMGNYEFGPDGKMLDGIVNKNGTLYYYVKGKAKAAGLVEIDGEYYFAGGSNGEIIVAQKKYVWEGNGILPEAEYEFGADGRMLRGIVDKNGVLCYYENGKPMKAGLVEYDGAYYNVEGSNGELTVGKKQHVSVGNGILPAGEYEFGADGRMLDGIVDKNGVLYFYIDGVAESYGLVEYNGAYYYAIGANGELAVDKTINVWKHNGLLPEGDYEFGPDGKMRDGFFEKNGERYYYEKGKPGRVGLNYIDGYYYFIIKDGLLAVNRTYYAWETNGLSVEMNYTFDELGRVVG
ncbi:MAG: phosphodiester glycosidase family protein [Clostridia bacterium]|nr:phosphodiester glycosidase family protein [Clostridia bacterium]